MNKLMCVVPLLLKFYLGDSVFHSKEQDEVSQDLQAVEGKRVSLPCDVNSSDGYDKVYMVLWFQHGSGYPIYSFDVRGKPLSQARHWSDAEVFGSRAYFQTILEPAQLVIEDVQRHDEGVYRCRVDFQNAQTRSFKYNLTVIVPPETPFIFDTWGRLLNGTIGPLKEGDDMSLTCRAVGGHPKPEVRWMVNGKVVDKDQEHNVGDVIENRIVWSDISRKDLNAMFTCQTQNTKLTEPKEAAVTLDLLLKPLTVEIKNVPHTLAVDKHYEISCESVGSRPPAVISWYKGDRQLRTSKEETANNITIGELSFMPSLEDHEKFLICRAENPMTNGLFLETSLKMNVIYPPIVDLALGTKLNPDNIKEGDDVYFECNVKANPPSKRLIWLHNGIKLHHNTTSRIIHSNQSLVIQKVNRENSGIYKCCAVNSEGETESNKLHFNVKYAPRCKTEKTIILGASRGESINVTCAVESNPEAQSFKWKFNNSGETVDITDEKFSKTSNGSISILKYVPLSELDFGLLYCWSTNSVGSQINPCTFQVVAAGKPFAVKNCTTLNQTLTAIEISCIPGFDGGLQQHFVLEAYTENSPNPKFNITSWTEPYFYIDNLETLASYKIKIFATNLKGRSPEVAFEGLMSQDTKEPSNLKKNLGLSSIFGILVGALLTVFLISSIILAAIRREKHDKKISVGEKIQSRPIIDRNLPSPEKSLTLNVLPKYTEERDPDVIPLNFDPPDMKNDSLVVKFNEFQVAPTTMLVDSPGSMAEQQLPNIFSSSFLLEQYLQCNNPVVMIGTLSKNSKLASWFLSNGVSELNGSIIKEKLMASRLPESCV